MTLQSVKSRFRIGAIGSIHYLQAPKPPVYSAGKPSKFAKEKLMVADGIIPMQSGSNKNDSQKGMTGFGVPRDVNQISKTKCGNIKEVTDEKKLGLIRTSERQQSGTNIYASQKASGGEQLKRFVKLR